MQTHKALVRGHLALEPDYLMRMNELNFKRQELLRNCDRGGREVTTERPETRDNLASDLRSSRAVMQKKN
jgi:hypothetical protein